MIGRARAEENGSGRGWIIWGWLLFIASLAHYYMIRQAFSKVILLEMIWDYRCYSRQLYEMVLQEIC